MLQDFKILKKLSAGLVLMTIMLTSLILSPMKQVHAAAFSDVVDGSRYAAPLAYLKEKGIVSGYPDGTFKPEQPINRAEALKILMLAAKISLNAPEDLNSGKFDDVKKADWFFPYVMTAQKGAIVEGYPDGLFKPEKQVNLAESLKMLVLSFQLDTDGTLLTQDPYPDVARGLWYARFAEYARKKNLIEPRADGNLHADTLLTRGTFAEIVYRLLYTAEKKLEQFPLNTNWPTYQNPTFGYEVRYPFEWEKIAAGDALILWKRDTNNGQVSFARIFPNSATVIIVVDKNAQKISLKNYLQKLQYDSNAVIEDGMVNGYPFVSVDLADSGLQDFYFQLPNDQILIIYSQMGNGGLKPFLEEEIRNITSSIRYDGNIAKVASQQDLLTKLRENLLLKDKGKALIDEMKDGTLIETDTIGIGTGPVDYYFSATYNITVKFERNSNTLLALQEGKSTSF